MNAEGGETERISEGWGMRIKSGRRKYSRVNLPSSDQNPMMYKLIFGWGNTIHNLWVAYICWKHRLNVRLCSVVLLAQGVVYLRVSLRITHALSIYCPFLWRLISQLPLWHVFKPKALYWSQSASPHHPHPPSPSVSFTIQVTFLCRPSRYLAYFSSTVRRLHQISCAGGYIREEALIWEYTSQVK